MSLNKENQNKSPEEEKDLTYEETVEMLSNAYKVEESKTWIKRLLSFLLVIAGFSFFIGFGNKNIIHYIVLTLMLGIVYFLGRMDLASEINREGFTQLQRLAENEKKYFMEFVEKGIFDEE